ncbi:hypothetical protein AB0I53_15120 [Saccharopolyspora sp. NPDC050389]|uniref:hypothetical protein n=1 Tax=Saccharopolyspora sp. NPDC050389 TaxID=3155516 RepID=UPI0033DBB3C4
MSTETVPTSGDDAEHWEAPEEVYWVNRLAQAEKSGTIPQEAAIVALERQS